MSNILDLGNGYRLRFSADSQDNRIGAIFEFTCPKAFDGRGINTGTVWFDVPATHALEAKEGRTRPKWTIVQEEPLTLSPSIHCVGECEVHGWVRDGKWVEA